MTPETKKLIDAFATVEKLIDVNTPAQAQALHNLKHAITEAEKAENTPKPEPLSDKYTDDYIKSKSRYANGYAAFGKLNDKTRAFNEGYFEGCKEVLRDLHPPQSTPEQGNGWISVEDRLPDCINILAYTGGLKITLTYIDGIYYTGDGNTWCSPVTYWMPLPPSPNQ